MTKWRWVSNMSFGYKNFFIMTDDLGKFRLYDEFEHTRYYLAYNRRCKPVFEGSYADCISHFEHLEQDFCRNYV